MGFICLKKTHKTRKKTPQSTKSPKEPMDPPNKKPHNRRMLPLTCILDAESETEFIYIHCSISSKIPSQHCKKHMKEYYGHMKEKNKLMPYVSAHIKCKTLQECSCYCTGLLILEQQLHYNLLRASWPQSIAPGYSPENSFVCVKKSLKYIFQENSGHFAMQQLQNIYFLNKNI